MKVPMKKSWLLMLALSSSLALAACSEKEDNAAGEKNSEVSETSAKKEEVVEEKLLNNITLSAPRGFVRDEVQFNVTDLKAEKPVELVWNSIDGEYIVEDLYAVIGPKFTEKEITIFEGTADADGKWAGKFNVPEGFGGDFTVWVKQGGKKIGQVGYTVDPSFVMEPQSGPVGTEITIKMEGLGWSTYMRNWQLTYDNKYTGLVTGISTNGTAEAKIRAAGSVGDHAIRLRTGYLGMQYINYLQSPYPDKPAPDFMFKITDGVAPTIANHVEEAPVAASGGVEMPELKQKKDVKVALSVDEGIVGDPVKLTSTGLPKDTEVELVWNTMKGSRVSGNGFAEEVTSLDKIKTDATGNLDYDFKVPDDLGGIPHRLDLVANGEVYGQTYLRILPSIVDFSPKSGPVGTKISITIKGGGWTEFDNAYYLTYDNAYTGYLCAFNSQGNLTFDVIATGDVGHHLIDLYPGIYKQKELATDMTLIPQLTYSTDHPGSAMPAIRLAFEVTK
ncbi:hypothetical protein AEA09_08310 [Lysinibacillus contaminans]|uniref:Lipoprotein n=1 Tax=Lysinibacillus contaminans TaxID=1293441 RepID=A0ABR5K0X9_9BACI|nr:hypothetical protein [Lysinibacillus contaminans]KOS68553.1 hypothetical protein AEA09_08310 [Lysinibacillus contaminans]